MIINTPDINGYSKDILLLDAESTLVKTEGVDFLAAMRGPKTGDEVKRITQEAMNGRIPFPMAFEQRWDAISPTKKEILGLSEECSKNLTPGSIQFIKEAIKFGITPIIVSGGITQALERSANELGVLGLHAIGLKFDEQGNYAGFDRENALATEEHGKARVAQRLLRIPGTRILGIVGDGKTDQIVHTLGYAENFFPVTVHRSNINPSILEGATYVYDGTDGDMTALLPHIEAAKAQNYRPDPSRIFVQWTGNTLGN